MEIIYNNKIDSECWRRVIKAGTIFDELKPRKTNMSKEKIRRKAERKAKEFEKELKPFWGIIKMRMRKLFKTNFPRMNIYVNSTPFSMDNYAKGYISISYDRKNDFLTSLIHEINHFIFRREYQDGSKKLGFSSEEIENMKEIITVVNNTIFGDIIKTPDYGWKKHQKGRKEFELMFLKNKKNLDKTFKEFTSEK